MSLRMFAKMACFKLSLLFQLATIVFTSMALNAMATEAYPLLDFCAGGSYEPCKDPAIVTIDDVIYKGMATPGDPKDNPAGVVIELATVTQWPGLHTQGLAAFRVIYDKGRLLNLHSHPRSAEIYHVVKGKLYDGFVATDNKLYAGFLEEGHAIIIPRGLVHFSLNVGIGRAEVIATNNHEDAGIQFIPQILFSSSNISEDVLAKGFGISAKTVRSLKTQFKAKYENI